MEDPRTYNPFDPTAGYEAAIAGRQRHYKRSVIFAMCVILAAFAVPVILHMLL